MSEERRAWNQQIIDEFRAHDGAVGGMFDGIPLMLLHHTGAKSGAAYISPLAYLADGESWVIFAANGGRPMHPGWYYNLRTNPSAAVEVGPSTHQVTARITQGSERDALCERYRQVSQSFADFEKATDREIPVLVLERADA